MLHRGAILRNTGVSLEVLLEKANKLRYPEMSFPSHDSMAAMAATAQVEIQGAAQAERSWADVARRARVQVPCLEERRTISSHRKSIESETQPLRLSLSWSRMPSRFIGLSLDPTGSMMARSAGTKRKAKRRLTVYTFKGLHGGERPTF